MRTILSQLTRRDDPCGRAGRLARILGATIAVCILVCAQAHADDRAVRMRELFASVRFVAYTPTELQVIGDRVRPASASGIRGDLNVLRRDFDGLILYSCADGVEQVPGIARALGYRAVIIGIWDIASEREFANAVRLAREYPRLVAGVAVGNETLLAQRHDWPRLRAALLRMRAALPGTPVTTTEPFHYYLDGNPPDFIELQDFLLVNVHPVYQPWFGPGADAQAVDFVVQVARRLAAVTDKPILVKETGLPSGPAELGFTPQRQAAFWRTLFERMPQESGVAVALFEAFDHAWKTENARKEFGFRPEEAHWGMYTEDGRPKPVVEILRRLRAKPVDSDVPTR